MRALAIETEGLVKSFGETRAVDGIDLAVDTGTVLRPRSERGREDHLHPRAATAPP
ncbi:MAG: hypothetical protein WKF43_04885 [Acidimicrobiales bacterium]